MNMKNSDIPSTDEIARLLGPAPLVDSIEATLNPNNVVEGGWQTIEEISTICRGAEAALTIRGTYRKAEHQSISVRWSKNFYVHGLRHRQVSLIRIGLANPRLWATTIGQNHIDIVDGLLVLALLRDKPNQKQALLVTQGSGASLKPAIAALTRNTNTNTWHVDGPLDKSRPAIELLCYKLKKNDEPDHDVFWQASGFARLINASKRFEEYTSTLNASEAAGSSAVN